jgi:hypothetical protein
MPSSAANDVVANTANASVKNSRFKIPSRYWSVQRLQYLCFQA